MGGQEELLGARARLAEREAKAHNPAGGVDPSSPDLAQVVKLANQKLGVPHRVEGRDDGPPGPQERPLFGSAGSSHQAQGLDDRGLQAPWTSRCRETKDESTARPPRRDGISSSGTARTRWPNT
jgi:hypothetical protein